MCACFDSSSSFGAEIETKCCVISTAGKLRSTAIDALVTKCEIHHKTKKSNIKIFAKSQANLNNLNRISIVSGRMTNSNILRNQTCATYMEGGELHWECRQLEGGEVKLTKRNK